jgi:hypothetical protein
MKNTKAVSYFFRIYTNTGIFYTNPYFTTFSFDLAGEFSAIYFKRTFDTAYKNPGIYHFSICQIKQLNQERLTGHRFV